MRIPFVGPAYQARSLNADCQLAINVYLEMDNASPRAPIALYGTPGLLLRLTLGTGPVRGMLKLGAVLIAVAGNTVYSVTSSYAVTTLGVITSNSGPVSMASNSTQCLIVDGAAGWLATTSALTQITDPEFPNGVTSAGYIGSYFIVCGDGTQQFYFSENPNDGAAWNGLDFASAEGSPDNTVSCIVNQLEAWFFGTGSGEIWVLDGTSNLLARSGNTFLEVGAPSAFTMAKLDSTIFWLGQDDQGAGIVWRAQGYSPARVSNHSIERAIQSYSDISDAFAFTYQQEGHGFYVLTFPSAGKTWVYDVATNEWHERAWRNPSTGALTRWRPSCHCYFNGQHLVGDFEGGEIYSLDLDTYTDNGDPILRRRRTQSLGKGGKRLFLSNLTVDMETGVGLATGQGSDPQVMLSYSDDDGHNFSTVKTRSMGAIGEYGKTVRFSGSLGATKRGHGRVWDLSVTDPVKFALFGADVDVAEGA